MGDIIPGLLYADDQFWLANDDSALCSMANEAEVWERQSGSKYHIGNSKKTVHIRFKLHNDCAGTDQTVYLHGVPCS